MRILRRSTEWIFPQRIWVEADMPKDEIIAPMTELEAQGYLEKDRVINLEKAKDWLSHPLLMSFQKLRQLENWLESNPEAMRDAKFLSLFADFIEFHLRLYKVSNSGSRGLAGKTMSPMLSYTLASKTLGSLLPSETRWFLSGDFLSKEKLVVDKLLKKLDPDYGKDSGASGKEGEAAAEKKGAGKELEAILGVTQSNEEISLAEYQRLMNYYEYLLKRGVPDSEKALFDALNNYLKQTFAKIVTAHSLNKTNNNPLSLEGPRVIFDNQERILFLELVRILPAEVMAPQIAPQNKVRALVQAAVNELVQDRGELGSETLHFSQTLDFFAQPDEDFLSKVGINSLQELIPAKEPDPDNPRADQESDFNRRLMFLRLTANSYQVGHFLSYVSHAEEFGTELHPRDYEILNGIIKRGKGQAPTYLNQHLLSRFERVLPILSAEDRAFRQNQAVIDARAAAGLEIEQKTEKSNRLQEQVVKNRATWLDQKLGTSSQYAQKIQNAQSERNRAEEELSQALKGSFFAYQLDKKDIFFSSFGASEDWKNFLASLKSTLSRRVIILKEKQVRNEALSTQEREILAAARRISVTLDEAAIERYLSSVQRQLEPCFTPLEEARMALQGREEDALSEIQSFIDREPDPEKRDALFRDSEASSADLKARQSELKRDISICSTRRDNLRIQEELWNDHQRFLKDPVGQAESMQKKLLKELQQRIHQHDLSAKDLVVLWSNKSPEILDPAVNPIMQVREKVRAVLLGVSATTGSAAAPGTLETGLQAVNFSAENWQESLYEAITKATNPDAIAQAVELSPEENFLEPNLNPIVRATVYKFRDEIYNTINATVQRAGKTAAWNTWKKEHQSLSNLLWKNWGDLSGESAMAQQNREKREQFEGEIAFQKGLSAKTEAQLNSHNLSPEQKAVMIQIVQRKVDNGYQPDQPAEANYQLGVSHLRSFIRQLSMPGQELQQALDEQLVRPLELQINNENKEFEPALEEFRANWDFFLKQRVSSFINRALDTIENLEGIPQTAHEKLKAKWENLLTGKLKDLDEEVHNLTFPLTKEDVARVKKCTLWVEHMTSLDMGYFKTLSEKIREENYLNEVFIHTHSKLGTWDHLDEDGKIKESALDTTNEESPAARFKALYEAREQTYKSFTASKEKVVKVMERDLAFMSEEDLMNSYQLDKPALIKLIAEINEGSNLLDEYWRELNTPNEQGKGVFETFAELWNQGGEQRDKAWGMFRHWDDFGKNLELAEQQTKDYSQFLTERQEMMGRAFNPVGLALGGYSLGVGKIKFDQFYVKGFSLRVIYGFIKKLFEMREERLQDRADYRLAELGEELLGGTAMGREFERLAEEKEQALVKKYETQYHDKNIWGWRDALKGLGNLPEDKHRVRALFNLMSESGNLRWDDPVILGALMRINPRIKFSDKDRKQGMLADLTNKVKMSCNGIWSIKVFEEWNTEMGGNAQKKREGYKAEFQKAASGDAKRQALQMMLKTFKSGKESQGENPVDPVKYEAFLEMAVVQGKMSMTDRLYYLIMGATTENADGQTLLSKQTLLRFGNDYMQNNPDWEFFADFVSSKKNGEIVPHGTPGSHKNGWNLHDMNCWKEMVDEGDGKFWPGKKVKQFRHRQILQSENVRRRGNRLSNGQQSMDHDESPAWFAHLTIGMVDTWGTTESNSNSKISADAWRGFLQGAVTWFEEQNAYVEQKERQGDQEGVNRLLMESSEKLKIALKLSQLLKRNYLTPRSKEEGSSVFLSASDFRDDIPEYDLNAKRDSDKIEGLADSVFDKTGFFQDETRKEMWKRMRKHGDSEISGHDDTKDKNGKPQLKIDTLRIFNRTLFSKEDSEKFFGSQDLMAMREALRSFGGSGSSTAHKDPDFAPVT